MSPGTWYHTYSMIETIALVTGANKGIGREISRQLAAKGILVLMGCRDPERGKKAVADLRDQGLPVEFIQIDVTSQPSVDQSAAEIERRHGRLDILVNNAGIALDESFVRRKSSWRVPIWRGAKRLVFWSRIGAANGTLGSNKRNLSNDLARGSPCLQSRCSPS